MSGFNSDSSSTALGEPEVTLIGQPCGHHGSYTFYKAFNYRRSSHHPKRVLMLGEFFFVRISPHDDPCIGELQLLWHDHQHDQMLSSTRLYFLPEQTPDGRLSHHGQHEVLAAHDKVILKLSDLVSWITHQVDWIAGLHYHWKSPVTVASSELCQTDHHNTSNDISANRQTVSYRAFIHNQNVIPPNGTAPFLTAQRFINDRCKIISNANPDALIRSFACSRLDFSDIIPHKIKANELQSDLSTVVVLSYQRYCRYRSLLKRIQGNESNLLNNLAVQDALAALGIPLQRNNRVNILFCRDSFNHEALLNNDLNCEHLAPKLKGRPRKRPVKHKSVARASSPESISSEDNGRTTPRRTRRSVALSSLSTAEVSSPIKKKSSKKSKSKRNVKKNDIEDEGVALRSANKNCKAGKENKCEVTTSSGNETDISTNSSVDANNNNDSGRTLNLKLKENCLKSESTFLEELNKFMTKRNTPINRVPNLGFKKINLHIFYIHAQKLGGYEQITKQRLWRKLYDIMGGDKRSTSAATCTRRHYEKLLLRFERYLNGLPDNLPLTKSIGESNASNTSKDEDEDKEIDEEEEIDNDEIDQEHSVASEDDDKVKIVPNDKNGLADSENHKSSFSPETKSKKSVSKQSIHQNKVIVEDDKLSSSVSLLPDQDQTINSDNEQEKVILKFSVNQITKTKISKPSECLDCEISISVKDCNSSQNKTSTSDDIKLLASTNQDLVKEDIPFSNIVNNNFQVFDNDDVKINLTNSDISEQEFKFIDKIESRQVNSETENESSKKRKQDNVSEDYSITIMPTSTTQTKSFFGSSSTLVPRSDRPNLPKVFSHSNSHNKMTALVHPTKRPTKNDDDIYDFKETATDDIELNKSQISEILLFKSNKDDHSKKKLSPSPLHSISTLIDKMPDTKGAAQSMTNNETKDVESISKPENDTTVDTQNKPVVKSYPTIANSPIPVARTLCSIPKPLESPTKILNALKNSPKRLFETIEPLPAHCNKGENFRDKCITSKFVKRADKTDTRSSPTTGANDFALQPNKEEILDLSMKKRCYEADSRTSSPLLKQSMLPHGSDGILLDLSFKKKTNNFEINPVSVTNVKRETTTNKAHKYQQNSSTPNKIDSTLTNPTLKFVKQKTNSNVSFNGSKNVALNQETIKNPIKFIAENSTGKADPLRNRSSHALPKSFKPGSLPTASHSKTAESGEKRKTVIHESKPNRNTLPSSKRHSTWSISPSPTQQSQSQVSNKPSISEYNPSLPSFISAPAFWSGSWPSVPMSMPPFLNALTSSSSSPNTAAGNIQPVIPSQFHFPTSLVTGDSNNPNSIVGSTMLDPKLVEIYTSPMFIKSLIEQNQFFNGNPNATMNSAFAQHLFTSSK